MRSQDSYLLFFFVFPLPCQTFPELWRCQRLCVCVLLSIYLWATKQLEALHQCLEEPQCHPEHFGHVPKWIFYDSDWLYSVILHFPARAVT